jgi:hypothetical protein
MFKIKTFSILLALSAAALPMSALAQNSPPGMTDAPSYSRPAPVIPGEDVIKGRVVSFDGGFNLQVNDEKGYVDNVRLHDGTIINPTGIRLAPGMAVTIHGVNRGNVLSANQIDTPYNSYGSAYDYGYPYGVAVYPYPVYGYPFYGPSLSVGIGFGGFHGHGRFR